MHHDAPAIYVTGETKASNHVFEFGRRRPLVGHLDFHSTVSMPSSEVTESEEA